MSHHEFVIQIKVDTESPQPYPKWALGFRMLEVPRGVCVYVLSGCSLKRQSSTAPKDALPEKRPLEYDLKHSGITFS